MFPYHTKLFRRIVVCNKVHKYFIGTKVRPEYAMLIHYTINKEIHMQHYKIQMHNIFSLGYKALIQDRLQIFEKFQPAKHTSQRHTSSDSFLNW